MSDVVTAFASKRSRVCGRFPGSVMGLGCTAGIRLHVQVDEQIPHEDKTALFPCTGPKGANDADFDTTKTARFGTRCRPQLRRHAVLNAKRLAFHYGLFVHDQSPTPPATTNSSSGCAELFGNDFMVAMGSWTPPNPAIHRPPRRRGEPIRAGGDLHARART